MEQLQLMDETQLKEIEDVFFIMYIIDTKYNWEYNEHFDGVGLCRICFDPLKNCPVYTLSCTDSFHPLCIFKNILNKDYKCPICKVDFDFFC